MDNDFPSLYTPPASASTVAPGASASTSTSNAAAAAEGSGSSSSGAVGSQSYAVGAHLLKEIHEQSESSTSSGTNGVSGAGSNKQASNRLDLDSETAFPSLGGGSAAASTGGSGWGAAARTRAAAAVSSTHASSGGGAGATILQSNIFTESLVLPTASINVTAPPPTTGPRGGFSNREAEPTTLGGVLSQLMSKYNGVKVESSTSTAKGTTTLLIKAQRQQDLERVKRDLLGRIVKKVNETLQVPASTRAFIIGSKGEYQFPNTTLPRLILAADILSFRLFASRQEPQSYH